MAESGSEESGSGKSIYEFDAGKSFFADGGNENTSFGDDGKVPEFEPTAIFAGTGTGGNDPNGNAGGSSGATPSAEPIRGRRGRPRGSRNASGPKASTYLGGWDDALFALHLMMASVSQCPEIAVTPEEAKKLTIALDRLAAHYHVAPSETAKVWMNFIGATGSIYGPKALTIYARTKKEKLERSGQKVVPFPGSN